MPKKTRRRPLHDSSNDAGPLFEKKRYGGRKRKKVNAVSEHLINAIDALKRERAKIEQTIEQLEGMLS